MERRGLQLIVVASSVLGILAEFPLTAEVPLTAKPDARFDGVLRRTADGREEAFLSPPYAANHASFVELAKDGTMVMSWFSGTAEGADLCSIVVSRLAPNATRWSKASVVSRRKGYSNQNPVLYFDKDTGILHLYHTQQKAKPAAVATSRKLLSDSTASPLAGREDNSQVWALQSVDGSGESWTDPELLFPKAGTFLRNRIVTAGVQWLVPAYSAKGPGALQHSLLKVTSDKGATWGEVELPKSTGLVQPSVIRLPAGGRDLQVYFRDRRSQFVYAAASGDDGATWTDASPTELPNNNAGIEATALASGAVALVFNNCHDTRTPLSIALSSDGGKTWGHVRDLEDATKLEGEEEEVQKKKKKGGKVEFSYPTLFQAPNGRIHISYTFNRATVKHVVVDEQWIKTGPPTKGIFKGD